MIPLPVFDCTPQGIKTAVEFQWNTLLASSSSSNNSNNNISNNTGMDLEQQPQNAQTEGLLFYCKETHYELGTTPLVCWMTTPEIVSMFSQPSQ